MSSAQSTAATRQKPGGRNPYLFLFHSAVGPRPAALGTVVGLYAAGAFNRKRRPYPAMAADAAAIQAAPRGSTAGEVGRRPLGRL